MTNNYNLQFEPVTHLYTLHFVFSMYHVINKDKITYNCSFKIY